MSSQSSNTREILDPVGEVQTTEHPLADRLETLEGTTIGFLDNAKANADVFLDEVAERLEDKYGIEAIHRAKDNTAVPAGSIAAYLDANCDVVVNAYGDCGSCTSWCIYDSVDLEQRGTPVATVNSDEFVRLGQSESRSLGLPGLPLVTVEHPMGDVDEQTVRARADAAVGEIVRVLTTDAESLADEFDEKFLAADDEIGDDELYCPL